MEVGCLGKLSAVCHGCSVHSCRIADVACPYSYAPPCMWLTVAAIVNSALPFISGGRRIRAAESGADAAGSGTQIIQIWSRRRGRSERMSGLADRWLQAEGIASRLGLPGLRGGTLVRLHGRRQESGQSVDQLLAEEERTPPWTSTMSSPRTSVGTRTRGMRTWTGSSSMTARTPGRAGS